MASKKKKYTIPKTGDIAKLVFTKLMAFYMFFMFAIYPLYYQDKYYNMGEAKWIFFSRVSVVFGALSAIVLTWYLGCFIVKKEFSKFVKDAFKQMNTADWFVLAYAVVVIISSAITPYKQHVIWGYDGWYMGLMAQLGFVLVYFLISRFWKWDSLYLFIYMFVAFVVFFFGVIMKFRVDPLEMYLDLDEQYVRNFLSTMGQATWYSSYLCIMYPLGVITFWKAKKAWVRVVFGIFTAVSFMSVVTQNSDSAYIAIAGIFFMLFWISMEDDQQFLRFLEVMMIALGSFKVIGILQKIFSDRMVPLDSLSIFMSQSSFTSIALGVVVVLYIIMRLVVKKNPEFDISKLKPVRYVALAAVLIAIIGGVTYIYMNSTGKLPEGKGSDNNYLYFDGSWGNWRGLSWQCATGTFKQCDITRKLFGAGPDGFAEEVYTYFKPELDARWGENTTLTCAHNEWLNALINVGILGLIAYLGIFISVFILCMKNAKKYPELYGVAISIVAYILHNFFCYQQIICTPVIFILMGMAVSLINNGYGEEE